MQEIVNTVIHLIFNFPKTFRCFIFDFSFDPSARKINGKCNEHFEGRQSARRTSIENEMSTAAAAVRACV